MTDYTTLLQRLQPKPDGEPSVLHRTGVVDAVNSDGTLDVTVAGVVIPSLPAIHSAPVGATVEILVWRGDMLVIGVANLAAFSYGGQVIFTSSDTFDKADYPGLRAVRVRMVGGGGGGGEAGATTAGQAATAGGGGGGAYAESFILESDLAASEAVTVGAGGAGGTGNGPNAGNPGTDSVFDTISGEVRADAGNGGGAGTAATATAAFGTGATGGLASSSTGDITFDGGDGGDAWATQSTRVLPGSGGGSQFAGRNSRGVVSTTTTGEAGKQYGGGGTGAGNGQSQAGVPDGGAGADGVVIVELFF